MTGAPKRRLAVVMFNLGGPDGAKAVRPFLFNLFRDPAIIALPNPLRWLVATLISRLREKSAQANYAIMGGGSPLLPETEKQARALEAALAAATPDIEVAVFTAMRYWHPFTEAVVAEVEAYAPDEVVLLPLYPQFSTTTTRSSLERWEELYKGPARVNAVCCYPTLDDFIAAHASLAKATFDKAGAPAGTRLLFSAHGLPEQVLKRGDPYVAQIEATAAAVAAGLGAGWDWQVCYQSRVGPMRWIGPSTTDAIGAAAKAGLGVMVLPIAFVSEHIETLVELDHEYAEIAEEAGCSHYLRVPALGTAPLFIAGLAEAVARARRSEAIGSACGWRCPAAFTACPMRSRP